jgi:hypothetical protein
MNPCLQGFVRSPELWPYSDISQMIEAENKGTVVPAWRGYVQYLNEINADKVGIHGSSD